MTKEDSVSPDVNYGRRHRSLKFTNCDRFIERQRVIHGRRNFPPTLFGTEAYEKGRGSQITATYSVLGDDLENDSVNGLSNDWAI